MPFDKLLMSPSNDQKTLEKTKAPLIYSYQSSQSQSNSECPGRKNKAKIRFEDNLQSKKQQKRHIKKSFEVMSNNSPTSTRNVNHMINFKDVLGEKCFKPHRPSLGYGSSPQASSSSSKYQFSNRSSNLSSKQQLLPESINHKTFNVKQQKPITKITQRKSHNRVVNPITISANRPQTLNLNRLSPQRQIIPQVSLTIAEEKDNAILKQAIIETPKFNQHYTLLGKHHVKVEKNNLRSKSLVKSQIFIQSNNSQQMQSDSDPDNKQNSQNNNSYQDYNYNIMASQKKNRLFMQSHSSCSQHEELIPQDTNTNQGKTKKVRVIKLKKTNIRFQQEGTQKQKQDVNSYLNIISDQQKNQANQNSARKITKDKTNFHNSGGIMIGSPKMQQRQQPAKDQCESSILSSLSSIKSDYDDIQISYVQTERLINQNQFSKDEIINYQQFLNQDYQQENQFQNIKKPNEPKNQRENSDLSGQKEALKIAKIKFINFQSKKFKNVLQENDQLLVNLDRIKDQEKNHSVESTYRQYSNHTKTRLQQQQNFSIVKNVHFTNAKQEFLEISTAKTHRQNQYSKKDIDTQDINLSKKIISNRFERNEIQASPLQLQTIESNEQSGSKFQDIIRKHNHQSSNFKPRSSIISCQSNIAIEGNLRQFKQLQQKYQSNLKTVNRSHPIILQHQNVLQRLILLLSSQEMCKLGIILSNKKLGLIKHQFNKLLNDKFIRHESIIMVQQWRVKYIPRVITSELSQYYSQFSSYQSQYDFEIEKDIERTFPNDQYFSKYSSNHNKMMRILRAVSYHVPQVGYVQGFNFIVGSLIKLLRSEEQVFWMFVNVLSWKNLYQLYTEGMPLLKLMQFQLNCFVQNLLPEVELFLSKRSILLEYFSSQWFLTLFSFDFDLDFFRIFLNQMLHFGPQFMIQLSLALISLIQEELLSKHTMEDAMEFLKEFPHYIRISIPKLFESAIEFTQVTPARLAELAQIYKTSKSKKRVLFVKDQDQDVTYLKTLPNLPDDEQMTECNVEEDSDDQKEKDEEYSPSVNAIKKRQINNSFYLNNVSSMDIRPNSGLDSDQGTKPNSRLLRYIDQEGNVDEKEVHLYLEEQKNDSMKDLRFEDYQYFSTESQDQTKASRVNQNIQSTNKLLQVNEFQAQIDEMSESTPVLSYQKLFSQNFAIQKNFQRYQNQEKNFDNNANKIQQNFEKHQKKVTEELLNQMSKRRFLHSPSLDNLRSSFKITQKRQSKRSIIHSPNSEDIIESERKPTDETKNPYTEHLIRKLGSLENQLYSNMKDNINESHNISNIEEFNNEIEYNQINERFQNTQRFTTRRDHRDDLTEREVLKLSWTKSRPLNKDLQLQFEINKLGSHLNTPIFQQTNRSNTILQEKKINKPINSFDFKKSNALLRKSIKISENQDPNKINDLHTNGINGLRQGQSQLRASNIQNVNQSQEDQVIQQSKLQIKAINNFQRFSATQKNPISKIQGKNSEKQNKILHNWSANNQRDSPEYIKTSRNKNNDHIEDVIKSMKSSGTNHSLARSSRLTSKMQGINTQTNSGSQTNREDIPSLSHRSHYQKGSGYLQISGSNDYEQYYPRGLGGINGHNILSPRTIANNKQSHQLVVHKGDNFYEEAEMTTIVTPKESFYNGRINTQIQIS